MNLGECPKVHAEMLIYSGLYLSETSEGCFRTFIGSASIYEHQKTLNLLSFRVLAKEFDNIKWMMPRFFGRSPQELVFFPSVVWMTCGGIFI